jgi:hypothetical protein
MPDAKKPGLYLEALPISNPRRMQGERSRRPNSQARPEKTNGQAVGECCPALNQP